MTRQAFCRQRNVAGLCLILILTSVAFAQVNAVYVESNVGQVKNKNSVYAYSNDGTGVLTAITGSPYLTHGSGVFEFNSVFSPGFRADQEIVINSAGTLLFAVNGNSDTIASFTINSDGSLSFLATAGSNGQDPVSIGLDETSPAGAQITVVNQAQDPLQTGGIPNITSFLVNLSTGVLTPVANSTIMYATGTVPSQALVNPSGNFVFVLGGKLLYSYSVGSDGLLTLVNSEKTIRGSLFLGEAAHPTQRVIYTGLPPVNQMGVYTYNPTGALAFAKDLVDPGSLLCWLTTDPKGTHLYTVESGTNTVTLWNIAGGNFLKPVQVQHFTMMPGGEATNLKLDPTGNFLYVLGLQPSTKTPGNFLHVLNVSSVDGTLTETLSPIQIPVHAGEVPMGLAVVMK